MIKMMMSDCFVTLIWLYVVMMSCCILFCNSCNTCCCLCTMLNTAVPIWAPLRWKQSNVYKCLFSVCYYRSFFLPKKILYRAKVASGWHPAVIMPAGDKPVYNTLWNDGKRQSALPHVGTTGCRHFFRQATNCLKNCSVKAIVVPQQVLRKWQALLWHHEPLSWHSQLSRNGLLNFCFKIAGSAEASWSRVLSNQSARACYRVNGLSAWLPHLPSQQQMWQQLQALPPSHYSLFL